MNVLGGYIEILISNMESPQHKVKLLCLHGMGLNVPFMKLQLEQLMKVL